MFIRKKIMENFGGGRGNNINNSLNNQILTINSINTIPKSYSIPKKFLNNNNNNNMSYPNINLNNNINSNNDGYNYGYNYMIWIVDIIYHYIILH